jgi:iron complex transport system substrate-binding protein
VLQRLGIRNAWLGKTSYWGFSLVSLDALADRSRLAAGPLRMVVIEPLPAGVRPRLRDSGLWRNLPAVAGAGAVHLPPTWSFGALPSARRFAELLLDAADELSAPGGRG